jgi:hypothetical protein
MEARMLLQPCHHLGVLVSALIVHDQMQLLFGAIFLVKLAQEFQEFLVPVAVVTEVKKAP